MTPKYLDFVLKPNFSFSLTRLLSSKCVVIYVVTKVEHQHLYTFSLFCDT